MKILLMILLIMASAVLGALGWAWYTLPDVSGIKGCMTTTMYHVQLCPTGSHYTSLKSVSPHVINAIVVAEDAAFFWHDGYDLDEILDSVKKNWQKGGWARGGSTITQQLAKNVFFTSEKSLLRKVRELLVAVELERTLTKQQILEKYLNVVEFGPNLYGLKDAARHYFSKAPGDLNILEGVFLAFLLPDPKTFAHSFEQRKLTVYGEKRLRDLLERLLRFKKITPEQFQLAISRLGEFPWRNLDAEVQAALHLSG